MNLPDNILEKNISELFGFTDLSEAEKAELLDNVGSTIIESALLRFAVTANEEEIASLEHFVDVHKDEEDILPQILESFPLLGQILEEEVLAFKREAMDVLEA